MGQFDTVPVNILQALTAGRQSFDHMRGLTKERDMMAARQEAAQALSGGGDPQNALARLISAGDMQGAQMLSSMGNNTRDFQFRQQESQRAQQNADRSYGLQERALNQKGEGIEQQVAQRRNAANQMGLAPSHPAYQSFILTGKMPREDQQPLSATDKKAILEADEGVLAANTAIDALTKAKSLSPKAMGNPIASKIAPMGAFFGNDTSEATVELDNLVQSNALSQLKSIFGGAPTEGERKILLEIQGSSGQPDAVRQRIYDRAIGLAQNRLKFNEQRAQEMRGGTFYKPQGAQSQPSPTGGGITKQQYDALPPGAPYTAPDGSQRTKR